MFEQWNKFPSVFEIAQVLSQRVEIIWKKDQFLQNTNTISFTTFEMTEAFTAGVMIFIEQFRARWPWSIGVLESWLSVSSSSSEVPVSSILRIPPPRRFVPGCGRHPQEWSPYVCSLQRLILQPFRNFTYVTAHSPTLPSLYLRHSSFSNPSVALPMSQFIIQPFFRFSYVTSSSLNE